MSHISQKDAVFSAITAVLQQNGFTYEPGTDVGAIMTRDLRAQVNQRLVDAFKAGTVKVDREYTEPELKAYVSGLQSNWLRKDTRLNGGTTTTTKRVTDPQLKNMYSLLKLVDSEADRAEIQACIDARKLEISST